MEVICPSCGEPLSVRAPELSGSAEVVCPGCAERITVREAPAASLGREAEDEPLGDVTIFQPGVTLGSLFPDEVDVGEPGPGRALRYTELVPGDEVRAGGTVMVFRTAGDGLGRR